MKQFTRSNFIGALTGNPAETGNEKRISPANEFANKVMPRFDNRATTTLNPYTGTFGTTELTHLLRRTLFGVTKADLAHFAGMTLSQVLSELLTLSATPQPPLNAYNDLNFLMPMFLSGKPG